jgi:hypothetical protein
MTSRARILIAALRALVLVLGASALWAARDGMNPDGVQYLDASDVYLSGRWPASGSGYWSPLYPMMLAGARLVAGTSAARELTIAQSVNFVLFLCAFAALEFLVREVRWATRARQPGAPPNDTTWRVLVYALLAAATVDWIRLWTLTPDMAVAAIVFAVAGLGVRLAIGRGPIVRASWFSGFCSVSDISPRRHCFPSALSSSRRSRFFSGDDPAESDRSRQWP